LTPVAVRRGVFHKEPNSFAETDRQKEGVSFAREKNRLGDRKKWKRHDLIRGKQQMGKRMRYRNVESKSGLIEGPAAQPKRGNKQEISGPNREKKNEKLFLRESKKKQKKKWREKKRKFKKQNKTDKKKKNRIKDI